MRAIRYPSLLYVGTAWLFLVGLGTVQMWKYKHTAAAEPAAPTHWPSASRLPHSSRLPTLLMFAHPRCACTRASLEELARLVTHVPGRLSVQVVLFRPNASSPDWARGELWDTAAAIPGVTVHDDEGGREAQLFHGLTSGHVSLYGVDGHRLFDGGLTGARGHAGDSPGLGSLFALAYGQTPERRRTVVYGCQIHDRDIDVVSGGEPCIR